jgi:transposase
MNRPEYFIGIDISADTIDVAVNQPEEKNTKYINSLENNYKGFDELIKKLSEHGVNKDNCIICLEITGVYSEKICYWLYNQGFNVWAEAPHKVHRAFRLQRKNDTVSALQIAEYGYRFFDQIKPFQPNDAIVEQVKSLISVREQLVSQRTANKNVLHALKRKQVQTPTANKAVEQTIEQLAKAIEEIEKELSSLIKNDPHSGPIASALDSIPGVGLLFIANFFALTNGFTTNLDYKRLASYLGICPHQKQSGTSVYRKPRSSGFGNPVVRKLLYLAAMSVKNNNAAFANYFTLKSAEGKENQVILNNIANKLLKIVCAVAQSGKRYSANYKSVHPRFLKTA